MGKKSVRKQARSVSSDSEARAVTAFNAKHQVGVTVQYWLGVRDKDQPSRVSTTRSKAQLLSGHTAVVWVEGEPGCVALSHVHVLSAVDVVEYEQQEAAALEYRRNVIQEVVAQWITSNELNGNTVTTCVEEVLEELRLKGVVTFTHVPIPKPDDVGRTLVEDVTAATAPGGEAEGLVDPGCCGQGPFVDTSDDVVDIGHP